MSKTEHDFDVVSGVKTTGHEWDGVKELNKPLPKWWLFTFYATVIWAIGYWIAYPAFPTLVGYTKGTLGYSQRLTVADELNGARTLQASFRDRISATSLEAIAQQEDLLRFAMAAGAAAFQSNCAPCHGRGAQGLVGYPNLNDDDWLWGGTLQDILTTIKVGVRSDSKATRTSQMPRYGLDKLLDEQQINDVTEYVLSLTGRSSDPAAVRSGQTIFSDQCTACHGMDGKGKQELGAPNLADEIWLYGGSKPAVAESIRTGRGGVMPAWAGRLDEVTLKSLAVYVHSLGGGARDRAP